MGQALGQGLVAALRRWAVVLILFLANLAAGFCFSAATWIWLSESLDNSLATRTLLTDLDWNVFVDLVAHHGESLRMLLTGGLLLAIPLMLIGVWLNAATVVAVGEDGSLGECLRRGLSMYRAFFGLSLLSNALLAAAAGASAVLGRTLMRWVAESASELTFYIAVGAAIFVGALLLVFLVTVHDHARVRSTARGGGTVRPYLWALRFVARREWRALPLALLLLTMSGTLWGLYQTVAMLIATNSAHGVILSLCWGQAFLLARMLLRVWSFAAATELQGLRQ